MVIEENVAGEELKQIPKQRPIREEGIPLAIIPASWCLTEKQYDTENVNRAKSEPNELCCCS
jgi:hypothetical protein